MKFTLKQTIFTVLGALVLMVTFHKTPVVYAEDLSQCLAMHGTFTGVNWPGGVKIAVSCKGDTGPSGCTGEYAEIDNGGSFNFTHCSCPPYASGCLEINTDLTKVQNGCTVDRQLKCGINGQSIDNSFGVACMVPSPTPTPKPQPTPTTPPTTTCGAWYCDSPNKCDNGARYQMAQKCTTGSNVTYPTKCDTSQCSISQPTPTKAPTPTPTRPAPTPTPAPSVCPVPSAVTNVKISCPSCGLQ